MGAIQSACALGWIGIAGPSRQCPGQRYKYTNENTRHKHSKANANMQNAGRNAKTKNQGPAMQMCIIQSVFADREGKTKQTKFNKENSRCVRMNIKCVRKLWSGQEQNPCRWGSRWGRRRRSARTSAAWLTTSSRRTSLGSR